MFLSFLGSFFRVNLCQSIRRKSFFSKSLFWSSGGLILNISSQHREIGNIYYHSFQALEHSTIESFFDCVLPAGVGFAHRIKVMRKFYHCMWIRIRGLVSSLTGYSQYFLEVQLRRCSACTLQVTVKNASYAFLLDGCLKDTRNTEGSKVAKSHLNLMQKSLTAQYCFDNSLTIPVGMHKTPCQSYEFSW